MEVRTWWSRILRRGSEPAPKPDYRGWRATWLAKNSMWVHTPGNPPDIEISHGCQGTVTDYVRPGTSGSHGYRITFDNGAVFGTYLPAPWAIRLDTPQDMKVAEP